MFRRILVAINNDDTSHLIFDEGITLAKQMGAKLMLGRFGLSWIH